MIKKDLDQKGDEVNLLISNNKKQKKILHWTPKFIGKKGLENALVKTINCFAIENNLSKYSKDYKI